MKRSNTALKRKVPGDADERDIDFDELPTYVGYQVRRTQARIFSEFETTLKDFDFTPGSFGVLTLIRANPGITQVTLAAAFGVDKSTMSPVIFRLEKRGLIRREILPADRRCHALFFDDAGESLFLAAREKIRAFEEECGNPSLQIGAARAGPSAGRSFREVERLLAATSWRSWHAGRASRGISGRVHACSASRDGTSCAGWPSMRAMRLPNRSSS